MSKYETINCKCGYSYASKEVSSTCPNCGKRNWSSSGGFIVIAIIVGLVILAGLIFGALGWVYYSKKNNYNKWHPLGASILGLVLVIFAQDIFPYYEYPFMTWILYLTNGAALIWGGLLFWQLHSSETTKTS